MKGNRQPRAMLAAWGLVGALALILVWPASKAMASVPLEEGVTKLAGQIVANSQSKNLKSIAIVPFINTDGSYSELSNFLVDELVLKLFSVPGNTMRLIERQQLGAMLAEMSLGWADIVSAESTQHLGKVHGVQGLVIGSITDMSDSLRITARLIETETGGVFSAAAINVSKSPTVQTLMGRRITMPSAGVAAARPTQGGVLEIKDSGASWSNDALKLTVFRATLNKARMTVVFVVESLTDERQYFRPWATDRATPLWVFDHGGYATNDGTFVGAKNCGASSGLQDRYCGRNDGGWLVADPGHQAMFTLAVEHKNALQSPLAVITFPFLHFTESHGGRLLSDRLTINGLVLHEED